MAFSRRQFHRTLGMACTAGLAAGAVEQFAMADETGMGPLETFVPTRAITGAHIIGSVITTGEFDRWVVWQTRLRSRDAHQPEMIPSVSAVDTQMLINGTGLARVELGLAGLHVAGVGDRSGRCGMILVLYTDLTLSKRTLRTPRGRSALSPDGKFGLSVDFRRIDNLRPGYDYDGLADPHVRDALRRSRNMEVNLATGDEKLIMSLADVAAIPGPVVIAIQLPGITSTIC